MAVTSGTNVLSVTAEQLASQPCRSVIIHNNDGSINVLIGGTQAAQNFTLGPGQTTGAIQVNNANQIWLKAASGTPTVSYLTS